MTQARAPLQVHRTDVRRSRSRGIIALVPFIPRVTRTSRPCRGAAGAGGRWRERHRIRLPLFRPHRRRPGHPGGVHRRPCEEDPNFRRVQTVASVRPNVTVPLVSMVSYSIVYRYGVERFVTAAKGAGFNGLILPDLPPPEAQAICEQVQAGGLDTILLVAPTTTPQRRGRCGVEQRVRLLLIRVRDHRRTGAASRDLADNVRQLKELTDRPVCVGFGISKPQHVAQLQGVADGAIVGSAFVKRMKGRLNAGPEGLASEVRLLAELLSGLRR